METEIVVLKFNEVSKRRELVSPTWFALSNDLFLHPDFFNLTAEEFRCWIWILSIASKMNKPDVRLNSEVFAHQCRCKEKVFFSTIEKLEGKRLTTRSRPDRGDATALSVSAQTDRTEHTEQTLHTVCSDQKSDQSQHLFQELSFFDKIKPVKLELIEAWRKIYPDDWLKAEFQKAEIWCLANPKKTPRSPGPFLTNWLSRGWESHRKKIPSNRGSELDFSVLRKQGA